MSAGADLTRWNRAGLTKIRYVDGNAITFLEDLRSASAGRFPEWERVTVASEETERPDETLERIVAQYGAAPGDPGWEILRTLARATHILTEHLDAYANESYLGTATEWDNVRKLVEMLDYSPAPPASASTSLVLGAKAEHAGTVARGLQVQHTPEDGGAPLVFETLVDLDVDATLNELRPVGWDRSPRLLTGSRLDLEGRLDDLAIGMPLILEDERNGRLEARLIAGVVVGETTTQVDLAAPALDHAALKAGWTRIHALPAERLAPLGPASDGAEIERGLNLEQPPSGLRPGEIVFIGDGVNAYYRRVTAVDGRRIVLDQALGQLHLDGAFVSRPRTVSVSHQVDESRPISAIQVVGDFSSLAGTTVADLKIAGRSRRLVHLEVFAASYQPIDPAAPDSGFTTLRISDPLGELRNPQAIYLPPVVEEWPVDSYLEPAPGNPLPLALVTGKPKKATGGDLVAVSRGRMLAWARLDSVTVDEDSATGSLGVTRWSHRSGAPFFLHATTVWAQFKEVTRVVGWDRNSTPFAGSRLSLSQAVPALEVGRRLLIAQRSGDLETAWLSSRVLEVSAGHQRIVIAPGLPRGSGYTVGNTVVFANVVEAGHGESRVEKVLASGDATVSAARHVLEVADLSFVADPTQSSGVGADLQLIVDGRIWNQVSTLRTAAATDARFTLRMTEEGWVAFDFGDGRNGRRLPTGTNNVRVSYRVGTGLEGNLAAGKLVDMVRPHRLLQTVDQPLPATGGNDMESAGSMRDNAPASILTLDRAVSLRDFANLATRQSSVWQAVAFFQPTTVGRHGSVEVVVVPAGGGELGGLTSSLRQFLEAHSLPGVRVTISPYTSSPFDLTVTFRVESDAYDPTEVEVSVREALLSTFSLERRGLGQDLFLSEVFQVVESVAGVENSTCVIDGDAELRRRRAEKREVIHLEAGASTLVIRSEEFEL